MAYNLSLIQRYSPTSVMGLGGDGGDDGFQNPAWDTYTGIQSANTVMSDTSFYYRDRDRDF